MTITDYASVSSNMDKISVAAVLGGFESGKATSNDVTLTYAKGDVTIKGAGDNRPISLVEGKTNIVRKFSTLGTFNQNDTAVTLAAGLSTDYSAAGSNVTSINSAAVKEAHSITAQDKPSFINNHGNNEVGLTLIGGTGNDLIVAGEAGDTINGGKGNDTLVGGAGKDVFIFGLNNSDSTNTVSAGNDVIVGFGTGDKLSLQSGVELADASIKSGTTNKFNAETGKLDKDSIGNNLILTFNYEGTGKVANVVTLQGVEWNKDASDVGQESLGTDIAIGNATYTFFKDGKIAQGDGITLTSGYGKEFVDSTDGTAKYSSIYAAANTKGISITGGDKTTKAVTITGSSGADLIQIHDSAESGQFTGGKGNDTFAFGGGEIGITDYSSTGSLGSDKITLASGFAMGTAETGEEAPKTLTAVNVDKDTVKLTFGEESDKNILSLTLADATKPTVTIADGVDSKKGGAGSKGTAYTFKQTGMYAVGKAATVIAGSGEFDSTAGVDGKTYSSVTGGAVTLNGSEATSALRLTLNGKGKAVGSKFADSLIANDGGTLTGGEGSDTFVYNGGAVKITDYVAADKVSLGAGWTITDVESVSGGEAGYKLTLKNTADETKTGTNTLTLDKIDSATKVSLTTTTYTDAAKTKTKTASADVYFFDHMITANNADSLKATAITVTGSGNGNGDFSTILNGTETVTTGKAGNVAKFAVASITSAGVDVTGNKNNNTITVDDGGTFKGGLGNDTFIIKGGQSVTISDFGIGAATVKAGAVNYTATGAEEQPKAVKLPTAITATVAANADASLVAYSDSVYAPGTDVLKINGTVTSAVYEVNDDKGTFSVGLAVDYDGEEGADGTIVLENIMRSCKADGTLTNSDIKTELGKIKIYQSTTFNEKYATLSGGLATASLLSGSTVEDWAKTAISQSPALDDLDNGSIDPVANTSSRTADNNNSITPSGDAAFSGSDNNSSNNHSGLNH